MFAANLSGIQSVLCLGAHSDDIEIGCGASILRMIEENPGVHIHWVVFSGGQDRATEARCSGERFLSGAAKTTIEVLDFEDRYFPDQWRLLKREFQRIASSVSPGLVLTHRRDDRHQDHQTISELTWNAFRDHLVFEYEIPKYEGDLGKTNLFLPATDRTVDKKMKILMESFPSQSAKHWFDDELFRSLMRLRGSECGHRYAEAFHAHKMVATI